MRVTSWCLSQSGGRCSIQSVFSTIFLGALYKQITHLLIQVVIDSLVFSKYALSNDHVPCMLPKDTSVTKWGMVPSLMGFTSLSLDLIKPGSVASIQLGSFIWDLSLGLNHVLTLFLLSLESEMS